MEHGIFSQVDRFLIKIIGPTASFTSSLQLGLMGLKISLPYPQFNSVEQIIDVCMSVLTKEPLLGDDIRICHMAADILFRAMDCFKTCLSTILTHHNVEDLFRKGVVSNRQPGPSAAARLMQHVAFRCTPQEKTILSKQLRDDLSYIQEHAVSGIRLEEAMDLIFLVNKDNPQALVDLALNKMHGAAVRMMAHNTCDFYNILYDSCDVVAPVLEPELFSLSSIRLPMLSEDTSCAYFGGATPVALTVHPDKSSRGITVTPPDGTDGLVFQRYKIEFPGAAADALVTLELPPCVITDAIISLADTGRNLHVKCSCGPSIDSVTNNSLGSFTLDATKKVHLMTNLAHACKYILLHCSTFLPNSSDKHNPEHDNSFQTPPDGVSFVHIEHDSNGSICVTPLRGNNSEHPRISQETITTQENEAQIQNKRRQRSIFPVNTNGTQYRSATIQNEDNPENQFANLPSVFPLQPEDPPFVLYLAVYGHVCLLENFEKGIIFRSQPPDQEDKQSKHDADDSRTIYSQSLNSTTNTILTTKILQSFSQMYKQFIRIQDELIERQNIMREVCMSGCEGVSEFTKLTYIACTEKHAEAFCLSSTLSHFFRNHQSVLLKYIDVIPPISPDCEGYDRIRMFSFQIANRLLKVLELEDSCLLLPSLRDELSTTTLSNIYEKSFPSSTLMSKHLENRLGESDTISHRPSLNLNNISDIETLYRGICLHETPTLAQSMLSTFVKRVSLSSCEWSWLVLDILKNTQTQENFRRVLNDMTFVVKVKGLAQPTMYNCLLQQLMKEVDTTDKVSARPLFIQSVLYVLTQAFPHIVTKQTSSTYSTGFLTVYITDKFRCRTTFRVAAYTPLYRLFNTFCLIKGVSRECAQFFFGAQLLIGLETLESLGIEYEATLFVQWLLPSLPTETLTKSQPHYFCEQQTLEESSQCKRDDSEMSAQMSSSPFPPSDQKTRDNFSNDQVSSSNSHFQFSAFSPETGLQIYQELPNGDTSLQNISSIGFLKHGEILSVLECNGKYLKISTSTNLLGWITLAGSGTLQPLHQDLRKPWFQITKQVSYSGGLPIYTTHNRNAPLLAMLQPGDIVFVEQCFTTGWAAIRWGKQTVWAPLLDENTSTALLQQLNITHAQFPCRKRTRAIPLDNDGSSSCISDSSTISTHILLKVEIQLYCGGIEDSEKQGRLIYQHVSVVDTVAVFLLELCQQLSCEVGSVELADCNGRLPGYTTFASLKFVHGDTVFVRKRRREIFTDSFITLYLKELDPFLDQKDASEATTIQVIQLLRAASISCVCDQYCFQQQSVPTSATFSFKGMAIRPIDTPSSMGMQDLDVLHVHRAQSHVQSPTCYLGEGGNFFKTKQVEPEGVPSVHNCDNLINNCPVGQQEEYSMTESSLSTSHLNLDVIPAAIPEPAEHMPARLFGLMSSPSFLKPLQRDVVLLMSYILKRISVNCTWRALAWVLWHKQLPGFLKAIATSEDELLEDSITDMLMTLCESVYTLTDARCCDTTTISLLHPHPLQRYFSCVRQLVEEYIYRCTHPQLVASQELTFLIDLTLPQYRTGSNLRIDWHEHILSSTQRAQDWTCNSCNQEYTSSHSVMRFSCTQGCSFHLCRHCIPFAAPQLAVELISFNALERLFNLLAYSTAQVNSPTDCRLRTMAFSLAQMADVRKIAQSDSFWCCVVACCLSADETLGVYTRCVIRNSVLQLLDVPLISENALCRLLRSVIESSRYVSDRGSILLLELIQCLALPISTQIVLRNPHLMHLVVQCATVVLSKQSLTVEKTSDTFARWKVVMLQNVHEIVTETVKRAGPHYLHQVWSQASAIRPTTNEVSQQRTITDYLSKPEREFIQENKKNMLNNSTGKESAFLEDVRFILASWIYYAPTAASGVAGVSTGLLFHTIGKTAKKVWSHNPRLQHRHVLRSLVKSKTEIPSQRPEFDFSLYHQPNTHIANNSMQQHIDAHSTQLLDSIRASWHKLNLVDGLDTNEIVSNDQTLHPTIVQAARRATFQEIKRRTVDQLLFDIMFQLVDGVDVASRMCVSLFFDIAKGQPATVADSSLLAFLLTLLLQDEAVIEFLQVQDGLGYLLATLRSVQWNVKSKNSAYCQKGLNTYLAVGLNGHVHAVSFAGNRNLQCAENVLKILQCIFTSSRNPVIKNSVPSDVLTSLLDHVVQLVDVFPSLAETVLVNTIQHWPKIGQSITTLLLQAPHTVYKINALCRLLTRTSQSLQSIADVYHHTLQEFMVEAEQKKQMEVLLAYNQLLRTCTTRYPFLIEVKLINTLISLCVRDVALSMNLTWQTHHELAAIWKLVTSTGTENLTYRMLARKSMVEGNTPSQYVSSPCMGEFSSVTDYENHLAKLLTPGMSVRLIGSIVTPSYEVPTGTLGSYLSYHAGVLFHVPSANKGDFLPVIHRPPFADLEIVRKNPTVVVGETVFVEMSAMTDAQRRGFIWRPSYHDLLGKLATVVCVNTDMDVVTVSASGVVATLPLQSVMPVPTKGTVETLCMRIATFTAACKLLASVAFLSANTGVHKFRHKKYCTMATSSPKSIQGACSVTVDYILAQLLSISEETPIREVQAKAHTLSQLCMHDARILQFVIDPHNAYIDTLVRNLQVISRNSESFPGKELDNNANSGVSPASCFNNPGNVSRMPDGYSHTIQPTFLLSLIFFSTLAGKQEVGEVLCQKLGPRGCACLLEHSYSCEEQQVVAPMLWSLMAQLLMASSLNKISTSFAQELATYLNLRLCPPKVLLRLLSLESMVHTILEVPRYVPDLPCPNIPDDWLFLSPEHTIPSLHLLIPSNLTIEQILRVLYPSIPHLPAYDTLYRGTSIIVNDLECHLGDKVCFQICQSNESMWGKIVRIEENFIWLRTSSSLKKIHITDVNVGAITPTQVVHHQTTHAYPEASTDECAGSDSCIYTYSQTRLHDLVNRKESVSFRLVVCPHTGKPTLISEMFNRSANSNASHCVTSTRVSNTHSSSTQNNFLKLLHNSGQLEQLIDLLAKQIPLDAQLFLSDDTNTRAVGVTGGHQDARRWLNRVKILSRIPGFLERAMMEHKFRSTIVSAVYFLQTKQSSKLGLPNENLCLTSSLDTESAFSLLDGIIYNVLDTASQHAHTHVTPVMLELELIQWYCARATNIAGTSIGDFVPVSSLDKIQPTVRRFNAVEATETDYAFFLGVSLISQEYLNNESTYPSQQHASQRLHSVQCLPTDTKQHVNMKEDTQCLLTQKSVNESNFTCSCPTLLQYRSKLLSNENLTVVGTVITAYPLSTQTAKDFYFEMSLVKAREAYAAIGISTNRDLQLMVGHVPGTIGFYSFDGSLRAGHNRYVPPSADCCPPGTVMGCGVKLDEKLVYFTRNGCIVGGFSNDLVNRARYPAVSGQLATLVFLNFGKSSFIFSAANRNLISRDYLIERGLLQSVNDMSMPISDGYSASLSSGPILSSRWDADLARSSQAKSLEIFISDLRILTKYAECLQFDVEGSNMRNSFVNSVQQSGLANVIESKLRNDSITDILGLMTVYQTLALFVSAIIPLPEAIPILLKVLEPLRSLEAVVHDHELVGGRFSNHGQKYLLQLLGSLSSKVLDTVNIKNVSVGEGVSKDNETESYLKETNQCDEDVDNGNDVGGDKKGRHDNITRWPFSDGNIKFPSKINSHIPPSQLQEDASVESNDALSHKYKKTLSHKRLQIVSDFSSTFSLTSTQSTSLTSTSLGRLSREISDAKRNLPCESTHAIFMCCDENNYHRIQVLITGAVDTPYSGGCFLFDVLCPINVSGST